MESQRNRTASASHAVPSSSLLRSFVAQNLRHAALLHLRHLAFRVLVPLALVVLDDLGTRTVATSSSEQRVRHEDHQLRYRALRHADAC